MDGSNQGFASVDGNRSWQVDQRPGQSIPQAHWHQGDPGVLPAGKVYGTGAPTGLVRYEGDAFGESFTGLILACDAGLGRVFGFRPIAVGAGFQFERMDLIWSETEEANQSQRSDGLSATWFRPTDIAIAPDGNLFVADWYDSYVGAHRVNDQEAAGRIYRVRPAASETAPQIARLTVPATTNPPSEQSVSLRCPAPEVRAMAGEVIRRRIEGSSVVTPIFTDDDSPLLRARWLWLQTDEQISSLNSLLNHNDAMNDDRQILMPILRRLLPNGIPPELTNENGLIDQAPEVRREVALSLRGRPLGESKEALLQLASSINPEDRFELEAFGLACEGHEESIYSDLRLRLGDSPASWTKQFQAIVWRLHPSIALPDLEERLHAESPSQAEIRLTVDSIGFMGTENGKTVLQEFLARLESESSLPSDELVEYVRYWVTRLDEQMLDQNNVATVAARSEPLPVRFQPAIVSKIDTARVNKIASKNGEPDRGRSLFFSEKATCGRCHRFKDEGGRIGPDLTSTSRRLDRRSLVESILYPNAAILTGYESWTVIDSSGHAWSGLLISTGKEIVLRSAEGKRIVVPREEVDSLIRHGHSLMPDSYGKTLSLQEIADLVAFLHKRK